MLINLLSMPWGSLEEAGCPAIPESLHQAIINTIKDGTCLFIYSLDKNYQRRSTLLNS